MTATSQASRVITETTCPPWCDEDLPCGPTEVLHCHDAPETWGVAGESVRARIRLGLERQDDQDGEGPPLISVQYLPDGRVVDATTSMRIEDGPALALAVLRLTAAGTGATIRELLDGLAQAEHKTQQRPAT